jgi:mannose-6-phosphate isomerase-like protein (cupin superfamily)
VYTQRIAIPAANYVTLPAMSEEVKETIEGDGYTVSSLDALGSGPGFRKIRTGLGVTAFGINAIVIPPNYASPKHSHERQEETYFVHEGTLEFEFGDGTKHRLGPGGIVRVDASTVRRVRNVGERDAIYVCAGGEGGYVGRDGVRGGDDEDSRGGFGK